MKNEQLGKRHSHGFFSGYAARLAGTRGVISGNILINEEERY
jgi:hypothetical protein